MLTGIGRLDFLNRFRCACRIDRSPNWNSICCDALRSAVAAPVVVDEALRFAVKALSRGTLRFGGMLLIK